MAYDPGAIDATLAAAVGDDPALIAELREAFLDSAGRVVEALERAESDEAWRNAAWRLKGLAASFGAEPVSAEELLDRVWEDDIDPFTATVKTTIRRLRAKLGEPPLIETVRESGYRIGGP